MAEKKNIQIELIETNKGQIEGVPANPRVIKDKKFKKLVKSIEKNPEMLDLREILVYPLGDKFITIGGNMRLEAVKKLGYKELPCKVLPVETPAENLRAYILRDNASYGEWDFDELANCWDIDELEIADIDLPSGFGLEEENETSEDDFCESETKTRVQVGQIWQLGNHRLMCGDSTKIENIIKLLDGQEPHMVLSDTPYGMHLDTDFSKIKGRLKAIAKTTGNKYRKVKGDNDDFTPEIITTFFDNLTKVKEMFLFGADYFAELLPNKNDGSWLVWDKRKNTQSEAFGSEFELCWSKNKHKRRMLRHDWFGFLSSQNQEDARNRVHPTQKPVSLLVDIINQWGGDCANVVDFYGGSGSTLMACEKTQKKCFLMELEPHYCDVIISRWEKLTGNVALRIE